ncbi:MAG: MFS transporter, partial [Bryobacteraceae bacterium]
MNSDTTAVKDRNAGSGASDFSSQTPTKGRWWLLFLISIMYLICYMDRANISVAQTEIAKEFSLSKTQMGLVFSAFAWAYAIGQIPAGWLGDKFGPKIVLTCIMLWWAVTAMGTGLAVGLTSLFAARFLLGLGEAGAFPVASRGMQPWFAQRERGRIQGITHFFSRFAVAVTPFVATVIMNRFGWRAIFWMFGSIGIVWALAYYLIYKNKPEDSKHVNQAELASIRGRNEDGTIKPANLAARPAIPWGRIFSSPNMWFIAIAYGCFFYGTYFFLTW